MSTIIRFFVKNRLFGDLITIFVFLLGLVSTILIRREVFPNINFDMISIVTAYPGASPEEVEKLVTSPIEQDLKEVDGIKKLTSVSIENRSAILAQLDPDQTTEAKAKDDIKNIVDQANMPDGAEDPLVIVIESKNQPIVEVAISADVDELELRTIAKDLESKLEDLPGVAKIAYKGMREKEIRVQVKTDALARYALTIEDVVNALKLQNRSIPAGTIEPENPTKENQEKIVRTVGEFKSLQDIENTMIRANESGIQIKVKDIASVAYSLEKRSMINRTNGANSISLTVLKKEKADAITMVERVRQEVEAFQKNDPRIQASFINDLSIFIKRRVGILASNMLVGIILVFTLLALFLPIRVALAATSGMGISFLGTISIFYYFGYSLNLISVMGLIIASGMLVDDAIVVADNIMRLVDEGKSPEEATVVGTEQVVAPVTASVLTTVLAFFPMLLMSGIFGKFIKFIPAGVIFTLMISLLESILILPGHMLHYVLLAKKKEPAKHFLARFKVRFLNWWDNVLTMKYARAVEKIVNNRYKLVIASLGFIIFTGIVASQSVKFVLFPSDGIDAFFIRAKIETGATLDMTLDRIKPIEALLAKLPPQELMNFVSTVGIIQNDANDPNVKRGTEYAQIAVYLTPEQDRHRMAFEIMEELRKQVPNADQFERLTFEKVAGGPPVGKPVSLSVQGRDYKQILEAVEGLKELVKNVKGVFDIQDSYIPGKEEVHIKVNPVAASAAGLNVTTIGNAVRGALDGIVATSIQEVDDEVDIRVSYVEFEKKSLSVLDNIWIPNNKGNQVPLKAIANFQVTRDISTYEHYNNKREIKVTGDVDTKVISATKANDEIRKLLPAFIKKFPNVNIDFGGEDEDTKESMASLGRAFLFAFVAIFMVLLLTFKNILQPVLVALTIPMGVIAVMWTFIIFRLPLSFLAVIGIIALAGVIVNNAIVLIDFVNQLRLEGMDRYKSITEAARLRLRPIVLTSVSTVLGLLPTAHGIGGLDKFVVPIVMALGYGLLLGSILTVFVFPASIAMLDDLYELFDRLKRKRQSN